MPSNFSENAKFLDLQVNCKVELEDAFNIPKQQASEQEVQEGDD